MPMPTEPKEPSRNHHRLRFYRKHGTRVKNEQVVSILERNIKALEDFRQETHAARGLEYRVADAITAASGSMAFFYIQVVWFGLWILWNVGILGFEPFDPFPFGLLTMIVSLEAIFLSTFVLVSQNRMAKLAEDRADLDLQINMLDEHEVTRLLRMTDAIAKKLGVEVPDDLGELKEDVKPQDVLRRIEGERRP